MYVLALADDLTGALEAGARFAAHGLRAIVTTAMKGTSTQPVVVIDTETRHLPPEEAAGIVANSAVASSRLVYKKTDSTLRGNIAAELAALSSALGGARIGYIPAYPALGRTVRNGRLSVHGVPVDRTEFGQDALNPVRSSSISELLGGGFPYTIHDGETDEDVAAAVAVELRAARVPVLAGPASVAAEIARQVDLPRTPGSPWPAAQRCFIVNGSRHPCSIAQVARAESGGAASANPGAPWRILRPPASPFSNAREMAAASGELVRQAIAAEAPDAILVFGGDTAFGILKALGCPALEPVGEVVPGVPVSRVVGYGFALITKAGGFGDEHLIAKVKQILNGTGE